MIKVHVGTDGTKSFQVYGRSRVRDKSVRVYVGSFASKRDAEHADQQHRVTQRGIRAGDLPPALDHTRTLGDALDAWLRAIKDQRSHDEYADRMRLYVRPEFDSTPVVKITKSKLLELRSDDAHAQALGVQGSSAGGRGHDREYGPRGMSEVYAGRSVSKTGEESLAAHRALTWWTTWLKTQPQFHSQGHFATARFCLLRHSHARWQSSRMRAILPAMALFCCV